MRFKDRVAIVTGSGRGIGRATVLGFVKDGGKAVISARTEADILSVKKEVEAMGGEAIAVICDVTDTAQIKNMIDKTIEAFGRLDYVVNNAAGGGGRGGDQPPSILHCTEDQWQSGINGTLTSVYKVSHYALPHILKSPNGAIVNISSTRGLSGRRGNIAYGAAKAGVINLTRCMALDLLEHKVRVNCVCPGHVFNEHMKATFDAMQNPEKIDEILAPWAPDVQEKIKERIEYFKKHPEQSVSVVGRGFDGFPDDLAHAILFLLSDEAQFVNGETMVVDGGSSAGK